MSLDEFDEYVERFAWALDLNQPEDRAVFRTRLERDAFAHMKFSRLRKFAGFPVASRQAAIHAIVQRHVRGLKCVG